MAESPPPVSPRLLDRHFRWRGTNVSRLEGVPGWVYAAIGPLMAAHGIREGRTIRRLQERH